MTTDKKTDVAEEAAGETGGHVAMTSGGVAGTPSVTDTWVTAMPHADATNANSLPKAVADSLDDKDHSDDEVVPDQGGRVFDEVAATANRDADK